MDRVRSRLVVATAIVAAAIVVLLLSSLGTLELDRTPRVVVAIVAGVVAIAAAFVAGLASLRAEDENRTLAAAAAADGESTAGIIDRARVLSVESERAGRRLATQIGSTLVGIAEIANESAAALGRANSLSDQVAHGASAMEEIQASVDSLARQITHQNELVDQSAAAIEEISANIDSVANVARSKRESAERLATLTEEGAETVNVSERLIGEVDEAVKNVTVMIRVINTIAAQTNLLAMNAAIEAAHAGDYGRGFAVVASEIRSLAESTSKNASQISKTLKDLGSIMSDAQAASGRTGEAFRSIREEAQSVSAAFGEITMSTEELSTGSNEIVDATEKLRGIAGETGISAEEMRIGAGEVTTILTAARETSSLNAAAMESIRTASRDVAEANSTISRQSAESNDRIAALLSLFAVGSEVNQSIGAEAKRRLQLANMVLDHLGWVSRIRRSLDEDGIITESELMDEETCDLGVWLSERPEEIIEHPDTLERLRSMHHNLHAAIAEISRVTTASPGSSTPEQFRTVLEHSREISELLMTYDEHEIRWTPDLSVGVSVFDSEHQRLFALVNRLYQVMRAGSDRQQLEQVFDELLDYTVYHFGHEEHAFDTFGYPAAAEHKRQHADLVRQASELRADLEANKPMVAVEVMEFLRDWVTNHIQGSDRRYTEFMRQHPVAAALEET